uniref:B box-type domain-containing protein n=1 Tax=Kalanchoe fedtschenkoi TaxID=63787 RepID=A0A7N0SXS4_KALFE
MKRRCELCSDPATIYCESDTASLCLRCDEDVHGANFLVAKHERSLLCSVCQAVTSWKASGPRLGRTVSVCDGCVCARSGTAGGGEKPELKEDDEEAESGDDYGGDDESDSSSSDDEQVEEEEDEDETDDEEEVEEGDDEENQVVPWSSGEEVSSSCNDRTLKRKRASSNLDSYEMESGRR